MPNSLRAAVRDALAHRIHSLFGIELADVALVYPPRLDLGDIASPVAFDLARSLKRAPAAIAARILEGMPAVPGVARMEIAGGGYINVFLDRAGAPRTLVEGLSGPPPGPAAAKVIVEHTNINPNKAAHIGHLRNAVLGDTLVRLLRWSGLHVEVQNYIDDTGVQVADLVVGFIHIEKVASTEAVDRLAARHGGKFDHLCWDLYAKVGELYEQDPGRRALRASTLKAMEEGQGLEAELARHVAPRIVRCHLATMERIGVQYDLLPWESHIIGLRFWSRTFELLKAAGAVRFVEEGERKGCWIMDLPGEGEAAAEEAKIIVRSNGTVTYVGKDIAYQLWKLGLLGADFRYGRFHSYPGGHQLWTTLASEGAADHPPFGGASAVYNVIDVRQSYPQRVVQQGLRALGHREAADRSHHFAYEMVALSASCARELGMGAEEESGRHVEMSGRRGYGVKADDLIDRLVEMAAAEVAQRAGDGGPDGGSESSEVAKRVAVAALRYFMLKYTRSKIIAFDFKEALSFEGETGPYLLYSVVRANNILNKMVEREGFDPSALPRMARETDFSFLASGPADDHWELLSLLVRFDDAVDQALRTLEPSVVARHAFVMAQRFNHFYHQHPVMQEPDAGLKAARTVITWLFLQYQRKALSLMGIEVPPRM
ncbi:MAG TPA: arginine--tRNA ligase [Candidatus Polarisedimenticolia bacterium]|nr:arginine--tRNA ligase [Candidatus Polarisedimenticolia bacterium]